MAGPGGGPSRRSHTKSRKGCKTCKKRHIRCDETFPQCRNCTKHQVRCDYLDSPSANAPESPKSPQQANLLWTAEIEATISIWQQTDEFPFPELRVYPQPLWRAYSKSELRLVHHLSSITNEMFRSQTSRLTTWTDLMPKFLSVAASHPFVMHSILAFSASHLAWISQSSDTRNLAFHHGSIALKGLHEAIANFSKANSDAVLASSLLLAWQATEWRGWASLVTGTKTVISAMQPWKHESLFADYIIEQGAIPNQNYMNPAGSIVTPDVRRDQLATIQLIQSSLQRISPYLTQYEQEGKWVEQLKAHIEKLRISNPPQGSQEQFQQLYYLRKWLFWVPISLLAARRGDVIVLLVLAHFYATALALEPMFSSIGAAFCANLSLPPLEEIIRIVGTLQSTQSYSQPTQAVVLMMDFPRDQASSYHARRDWLLQQDEQLEPTHQASYALDTLNLEFESQIAQCSYGASLSPAFAPSPLSYVPSGVVSGQTSPYLEVPRSMDGFGGGNVYVSSPLESPAVAPMAYAQDEHVYSFNMPMGYPSGFVATPAVWT
ncbi:uncharacterized protein BDZ99DRAFT_377424 [Mytilinidion resinicola]|uniref:Zn(2)-C6 fungal-type domain-containing protein n=1 Tax=Mytilinidion resinicola TaxID=574789 RepID=A0A6A6Z4K9_9PEZI|nr:uncharacterized protein BDZ99DRAFT_377424 [Mytilinidion resinicola]KAF2816006.1 hypothetical protein BDZ99DRAFT_377424 [Mytilinidion resinicola]